MNTKRTYIKSLSHTHATSSHTRTRTHTVSQTRTHTHTHTWCTNRAVAARQTQSSPQTCVVTTTSITPSSVTSSKHVRAVRSSKRVKSPRLESVSHWFKAYQSVVSNSKIVIELRLDVHDERNCSSCVCVRERERERESSTKTSCT
jgi:hypothetical protein